MFNTHTKRSAATTCRKAVPFNNAALMMTVAALALPAGAQADSTVSASAVAKASAHAELHLDRVGKLAGHTSASARHKADVLMTRSRGELKTAVRKTQALLASAQSPEQIEVAARVSAGMGATLADDARLQSQIAIEGGAKIERRAATALVSDVRMQQAVIAATLRAARDSAEQHAQAVVDSSTGAVEDLTTEIQASAEAAASSQVGVRAQASAELAVGIGADALSTTAELAAEIPAQAEATTAVAVERLRHAVADAAGQISATIKDTLIGPAHVTVDGDGDVTLDVLVQAALAASAG